MPIHEKLRNTYCWLFENCETIKKLDKKTLKAYRIDLSQFYAFMQKYPDFTERRYLNEYISSLRQQFQPKTAKMQNLIYFVLQSTHKSISINYSEFVDSFQTSVSPFVSKQEISKTRQGFHIRLFLNYFIYQLKSFIINQRIYIRGMIFTFILLTVVQYRLQNQEKTTVYLEKIQIK